MLCAVSEYTECGVRAHHSGIAALKRSACDAAAVISCADDATSFQKAFSLLKNRDVLYIDDEDRVEKYNMRAERRKPLSQCPYAVVVVVDLPLAFARCSRWLSLSLLLKSNASIHSFLILFLPLKIEKTWFEGEAIHTYTVVDMRVRK
jgi:hypothetical protein